MIVLLTIAAVLTLAPGDAQQARPLDGLPESVTACQALPPELAVATLRDISGGRMVRKSETSDTCTYRRKKGRVVVSVGLYSADGYDAVADALPESTGKRDTVEGHRAIYHKRLGYLIEMPGRPFYLQVTYFHALHVHAEPSASRRLAQAILTAEETPPGRFLCSLSGKPI